MRNQGQGYSDEVLDGVAKEDEVHALAAHHVVVLRLEHVQSLLERQTAQCNNNENQLAKDLEFH